jgi:hypothetical protein
LRYMCEVNVMLRFFIGLILGALLGAYIASTYPHQLHNVVAQIGPSSSPPIANEPRTKSHTEFP